MSGPNNIDGSRNATISELTLDELFGKTLTDTSCIYIDKDREVWIATEMCAHYLESAIDSIVVQDQDNQKSLGIVGGYDLLNHLRKNPNRESQYLTSVEQIMFKDLPQIERTTKFGDLMKSWKNSRRAFAYVPNERGDLSPISARKMLEVGMRSQTIGNISISSIIPRKDRIVSFQASDTLGTVLDLMFDNNTRKLMLEGSNQFISDRLILGEISRIIKFQENLEYFLDLPVKSFHLEYVWELEEDVSLSRLCSLMDKMDHPYVIYKSDTIISPWDVCLALSSDDLTAPPSLLSGMEEYQRTRVAATCPHCGKNIGPW